MSFDRKAEAGRFAGLRPYRAAGQEIQIRLYQIAAEEIGYLCSMVEAYDGIGLIRTLDRERGLVECWVMPDAAPTFDRLIERLREDFPIEPRRIEDLE